MEEERYSEGEEPEELIDYDDLREEEEGKTLLELTKGPNKHAAKQEIDERVYKLAVACNFIAWRLMNSSGGPAPHRFATETREFIQDHPRINVRLPNGKPPPFLYDGPPAANLE